MPSPRARHSPAVTALKLPCRRLGYNSFGQATALETGNAVAIAARRAQPGAEGRRPVVARGDNDYGMVTVPTARRATSRHRRGHVPQPGAADQRYRRRLGLQRPGPDNRAERAEHRHRHRRGWQQQPGAAGQWHRRRLGQRPLRPDDRAERAGRRYRRGPAAQPGAEADGTVVGWGSNSYETTVPPGWRSSPRRGRTTTWR